MSDISHLTLDVKPKAVIRSWKDLLAAAKALEDDADRHSYRAWPSAGRRYCANVKVYSYGCADTAINKLGVIDPLVLETLEEDFSEAACEDIYHEWISSSAEYLEDWLRGSSHSTPEYLECIATKVKAGESTGYPFLDNLSTKRERLASVREWQRENALFFEAFNVVDGDSLCWEGRSGGYITWNASYDVDRTAREIADVAHDVLYEGERADFHETLREFRCVERAHNLNTALIIYVEQWAKSMDFQDELEYQIRQRFDEMGGSEKLSCKNNDYGDVVVTIQDSLDAGNCRSGTMSWIERNLPGRSSATVKELLQIADSSSLVRRLCRFVIRRQAQPA